MTEVAEEVGCENPQLQETDELFVRELATCDNGGTVRTFASNDARDDWLEAAEHFGGVYGKGDFYTIEEPSGD